MFKSIFINVTVQGIAHCVHNRTLCNRSPWRRAHANELSPEAGLVSVGVALPRDRATALETCVC